MVGNTKKDTDMVVDEVNERVMELWKEHVNFDDARVPLIYPSLETGVLLFIGLNPSFVPTELARILQLEAILVKNLFSWKGHTEDSIEECKKADKRCRELYKRFFGPFEKFSKEVGLKWEHVDLFFYRATDQNDLKKVVCKTEHTSKVELNDFGLRQLELSGKLIGAVNPRVIVVANRLASDIFKEEYRLKWNDDRGCYVWQPQLGKDVPVFLSSMLAGQRALDVYSRERLVWHVKKAINENPNG